MDKNDRIDKKEIYSKFMDYLKEEGMDGDQMKAKGFHKAMHDKGFEPSKVQGVWYYKSIKLKIESMMSNDDEDDIL